MSRHKQLARAKREIRKSVAALIRHYVVHGEGDFTSQGCVRAGLINDGDDIPAEIVAFGEMLARQMSPGPSWAAASESEDDEPPTADEDRP